MQIGRMEFFKTIVQLYAVYESPNLDPKTQMGWKGKAERIKTNSIWIVSKIILYYNDMMW